MSELINRMHRQDGLAVVIQNIAQWHHDRNLIDGSDDVAQLKKLREEINELSYSVGKDLSPVDDIGDIVVVLINFCERYHLTLTECLYHAYNDIKDRTGKINPVTGMWDKDL